MPNITVRLEGDQETMRAIEDARKALSAGAVQEPLLEGAKILRDEWKRRVERGPGHFPKGLGGIHLRDYIFASKGVKGIPSVVAGVNTKKAPQGFWLEYGISPHRIPKKGLARLFFGGRWHRFVQHPGLKKKPFIRPGIQAKQTEVLFKIREALARLLGRNIRTQVPSIGGEFL